MAALLFAIMWKPDARLTRREITSISFPSLEDGKKNQLPKCCVILRVMLHRQNPSDSTTNLETRIHKQYICSLSFLGTCLTGTVQSRWTPGFRTRCSLWLSQIRAWTRWCMDHTRPTSGGNASAVSKEFSVNHGGAVLLVSRTQMHYLRTAFLLVYLAGSHNYCNV
jgi:hypothetical protein